MKVKKMPIALKYIRMGRTPRKKNIAIKTKEFSDAHKKTQHSITTSKPYPVISVYFIYVS